MFSINPLASWNGTLSVQIDLPDTSDVYSVEYRQKIGFDANIVVPQGLLGPQLRLVTSHNTYLLTMNPAGENESFADPMVDPTLHVGQRFVDYANRFSVSGVSKSPTGAQVRILIPTLASPAVLLTAPTAGASVSGTTALSVDALDRTGVTKVEFYRDGTLLGTAASSPYTYSWDTRSEKAGSHLLLARAYNSRGGASTDSVTVTVQKAFCNLVAPTAGSVYSVGQTITVVGAVVAPAGVSRVEFFADGVSIGAGSPISVNTYAVNWSTNVGGAYTLTARLTDSTGSTADSGPVGIRVNRRTRGGGSSSRR